MGGHSLKAGLCRCGTMNGWQSISQGALLRAVEDIVGDEADAITVTKNWIRPCRLGRSPMWRGSICADMAMWNEGAAFSVRETFSR